MLTQRKIHFAITNDQLIYIHTSGKTYIRPNLFISGIEYYYYVDVHINSSVTIIPVVQSPTRNNNNNIYQIMIDMILNEISS